MNNIITVDFTGGDGAPLTMSSVEIAELCDKQHRGVLRDIRKMLSALYGTDGMHKSVQSGFEGTYRDLSGIERPCFHLPRRECLILISGYKLGLRAKIIDRWEELEAKVANQPAPAANTNLNIEGLEKYIEQLVEAKLAADSRVAVMQYTSVRQILADDWRVPQRKRRSIQRKVFNRLSAHCLESGVKAYRCAHSNTWLFPRYEAADFVRKNCEGIIREHIDRVTGQGRLRLVPKADNDASSKIPRGLGDLYKRGIIFE